LDTRHRKIDSGNIGRRTQTERHVQHQVCVLCPMLPVSIILCLVPDVTRVYLSVSCTQCYPCLSFCVFCPMLPVSIFLCIVSNVSRVHLSVSCVQCYPCLSFCVLFPMLPVSIFLCIVPNVTRFYFSVSRVQCYPCLSFCVLCPMLYVLTLDTRHRKIYTNNIGHKTQKDRHG
jgi:hypothetical protein